MGEALPRMPGLDRVLWGAAITLVAALVEVFAAVRGHSIFLWADALHLFAHLAIFGVLVLLGRGRAERGATVGVLILIACIALCVIGVSVNALVRGPGAAPVPELMLISLVGLGANISTAILLARGAKAHLSFRAAVAHELSDGAMTLCGLLGAWAIHRFGWQWVDPSLSLVLGLWLLAWAALHWPRRRIAGWR